MKAHVGKGAITGFLITSLVLLLSGWLSYHNLSRLRANERWVVHTREVLDELRDIELTLTNAESAQRSYLITGEAIYLEPYRNELRAVRAHFETVQKLTTDNQQQQLRLTDLSPVIEARVQSLEVGIFARNRQGAEGGRSHVASGKGRREMEFIRVTLHEMQQTEVDLLKAREEESLRSYRTAVATQLASTLLGLGLVGAGYWLTARELETRRRGVEALARANDELEARVEARTADLGAANESLRRSNRELEQFASVASHDLQEPLRKIQAFGDRLLTRCSSDLGEQGRDYLARMLASAGRMRSLIDALLSFSRVTTKAQPFVPVDLQATTEDVVSDLEAQTQRSGGSIEVGELPTLEADPLQMRQLMQNLIGNGLKFSRPEEPPIVRVESRMLEDTNGAENDGKPPCCQISVSDNGIGFEEIYLDRIFELFQRLHGRQEYEGTGMGLAICRKIVERHHGTITATSEPGRGATFLVTLPLRQE